MPSGWEGDLPAGGGGGDQFGERSIERGDLGGQCLMAARHGGHRRFGAPGWAGEVTGAEPGGHVHPPRGRRRRELLPQLPRRSVTDVGFGHEQFAIYIWRSMRRTETPLPCRAPAAAGERWRSWVSSTLTAIITVTGPGSTTSRESVAELKRGKPPETTEIQAIK